MDPLDRLEQIVDEDVSHLIKQVRQQREDHRQLMLDWIEYTPIPMWIHDRDLRITNVNSAALEQYGYEKDEFLSMTLYDLRTPEEAERLRHHVAEHRSNFNQGGWYHKRKDGSTFEVAITATDYPPAGPDHRLIMARDLTQQMEYERRMRELGALSTASMTAAYLFHDIANLLHSGNTYLTLGARLATDPKQQEYLKKALATLTEVNSIMRASIGKEERFSPKPISINDLVDRCRAFLNAILPSEYDLQTDLHARRKALVDPQHFGRMTANFAINARQAMPNGGIFRINTDDESSFVRVTYQDTGIGMTRQQKQELFKRFVTFRGEGTGLGLAGVYNTVVNLHKGDINVQSVPGKGTRFDVYFPAA